MYKEDLALNDLQGLICHKTQRTLSNVFSICHLMLRKYFDGSQRQKVRGRLLHKFF